MPAWPSSAKCQVFTRRQKEPKPDMTGSKKRTSNVRFTPESRRGRGRSRESEVDPQRLFRRQRSSGPTGLIEHHDSRVLATAGDTISDIDWDNVGDNLDDEGKNAEIAAAAGPRYCAVASLR